MKKLITFIALVVLFSAKTSFAQVSFPLDIDASPMSINESDTWYDINDGFTNGYLIPSFFYGTTSYGTGWTVESALSGPLPSGVTLDELAVSLAIEGIDPNDSQDIPTNTTIVNGTVDINLGEFDWSLYDHVIFEWSAWYSDGGFDDYSQDWTL